MFRGNKPNANYLVEQSVLLNSIQNKIKWVFITHSN